MSRNVHACAAFSRIFPLEVLRNYVMTEHFGTEVRALLVRLLRNLYIDREPYEIQRKPDLVIVFEYEKTMLEVKPIKEKSLLMSGI